MKKNSTAIKIPYKQLSPEALQGLIEQFVCRDGTDSGHIETPFEDKVAQVIKQLDSGVAVLVFDQVSESCDIISINDPLLKDLNL